MKVAFLQKSAYEKVSVHYLAGALRASGHAYDLFIEDLEDDFYGAIQAFKPDVVVYSLFLGEENATFRYFQEIKKRMAGVATAVGGPFTLIFPETVENDAVDFVFRGDGEFTLPEFLRRLESGESLDGIDGLIFKGQSGEEHRDDCVKLVDPAEIPAPDRDLYYKYDVLRNSNTKLFIASRGCPYRCTYCYNAELSKFFDTSYWRLRPVADVIEEIRYVKNTYGCEWVHFQDGTFNASRPWLKEFLTAYMEENLPEFLCNCRVENFDDEIARLMKEAGCNRITFGIQSGNSEVRRTLSGRAMSNEKIIEACRLCREYGIRVNVDIIFGWPGETLEQAMDTIRLCRQVDAEIYSSNVLIYYPRLKITRYAVEHGHIPAEPTLEDLRRQTPNMSPLIAPNRDQLINLDKFFNYLIKYPALEPLFLLLAKLPPNKLFYVLKNLHILSRSLKYDTHIPRSRLVWNYLVRSWKAV